jgi:hypothetical protein
MPTNLDPTLHGLGTPQQGPSAPLPCWAGAFRYPRSSIPHLRQCLGLNARPRYLSQAGQRQFRLLRITQPTTMATRVIDPKTAWERPKKVSPSSVDASAAITAKRSTIMMSCFRSRLA